MLDAAIQNLSENTFSNEVEFIASGRKSGKCLVKRAALLL